MRYNCGALLAKRDDVEPDNVAGVPDSGIAHAIGYSNESGIPFSRPFIKYTPTWPRSFMPTIQSQRNLIAKMKLIPVHDLIQDKSLLLIDDSIVRGTQLRETTEFLYQSGAKEVHIRPACPPLLYGCKYLPFLLGDGSDHQKDHQGDGGRRKKCELKCLLKSGDTGVSGNGKADRRSAEFYNASLSQAG